MADPTDIPEYNDEMRSLLKERFQPSEVTLEKVIQKMGEARQIEALADMPH